MKRFRRLLVRVDNNDRVIMLLSTSKQKARENMITFEERSDGGVCISADQAQVNLSPGEAFALWQWLSAHNPAFQAHPNEKQLEIHLFQEDLDHLDELKAAIPSLHERGLIVKVFDARWEAISERALQLLKEYQIEYHVHPLLEDDYTYAQG